MEDIKKRLKSREFSALIRRESMRIIMLLVEQIRSLQDAFFDEDLYLPESGEHLQEWYKERYSITKLTGRHLHEQYSFNNLYG